MLLVLNININLSLQNEVLFKFYYYNILINFFYTLFYWLNIKLSKHISVNLLNFNKKYIMYIKK